MRGRIGRELATISRCPSRRAWTAASAGLLIEVDLSMLPSLSPSTSASRSFGVRCARSPIATSRLAERCLLLAAGVPAGLS